MPTRRRPVRLDDLIEYVAAIADHPDDDADLRLRKHALAVTAAGLIPASLLWILIGFAIDRQFLAISSVYFALALLAGLLVMGVLKVFDTVVRGLLLAGMVYVFLGHVALGGLAAGGASLVWGIVAPVSAVLYFDRRRSLYWFGGYVAMVVVAIAFDGLVRSWSPASWQVAPVWLFAYNLLGPALIVLLLIRFVDGQRLDARARAQSLLLEMLPASIAERLSRGERVIADTHPSATVLFADVVNFTGMAATMEPRDVLLLLNQLFSVFDRLAAKHGLWKIKTVGDAYVAVAGAPTPREDHARAAVEMGIEMHRAVARLAGLRRRGIRLRVGVASGPITAGVIGENRWAYDVWGDTVNMAARMESYGVPGLVQVAPATREMLADAFPLTMRTVDVKGKGIVATYLIDPVEVEAYLPPVADQPVSTGVEADEPMQEPPAARAFASA
jgi:adenylate cyclase